MLHLTRGFRFALRTAAPALSGLVACMVVDGAAAAQTSLAQARSGFVTDFHAPRLPSAPVPVPTPGQGRLVHYPAAVGSLAGLLTAVPMDGRRHPAMIWITGGDFTSIDGSVWQAATPRDDQTARQYREAGIVTLYPSLRGGNDNPGRREGYYGEVDDVLAAADWLAAQPGIDPQRIYLGGHSTGATLVLLVAEASPRFRAVFAFGPVADPAEYRDADVPMDMTNEREMDLRRPITWLDSMRAPLFVFEGASGPVSNIRDLYKLEHATRNPDIHFEPVPGADHFSVLAPANQLIAQKVRADTGTVSNIAFSSGELNGLIRSLPQR